ncbi:hypothetical protein PR202_gb01379 [Eleusine coracana subsp. coracana]|uniref:Protein kinase domain-containing protein n=1 Tax=Eleusine coracana subsp. coracana TaxID=191504 RepID=A0AAV5DVH1_ELECO|nr:hypothetical protein QOZ80_5BG0418990 [Eleusine coracana subsp. coracana]GJN14538.1 hypothetical protein PR202_gb01379 [Eleusine coracana subsp. coracana]
MASVSSRLSALCAKIQGLAEPGTDEALRRVSMACICVAMHDLGKAAMPSSSRSTTRTTTRKRKSLTPITLSQFVDDECMLGEGDSGFVSRFHDRTTGKTLAVKALFPLPYEEEGSEDDMATFNLRVLREACFMAACRGHPSLVRLHAVCIEPDTDRYCLAMEHVGPTLDDVNGQRRRNGVPFREHEVRRIIRQVLSGAKAMHDRGIVHRNIVSENVLVAACGDVVKIGGFGQATCVSETVDPCENTLWDNSAPEVLFKGQGACQSVLLDSWSIGCLMAELLTGYPLFMYAKLNVIFRVLGSPDKGDLEDIKPQDLDRAEAVVREWRARQQVWKKLRFGNRLRREVPRKVLSDDGFEVLRGLVALNPKKRLTADAALQLPWFANDDNAPATTSVLRPRPFRWLLIAGVPALLFLVGFCLLWRHQIQLI